jgi:hypothetical protein
LGKVHGSGRGSLSPLQFLFRSVAASGCCPAPRAWPGTAYAYGFELGYFATTAAYHSRDATASGDSADDDYRVRDTDCDSGTVCGKSGDDGTKRAVFVYGFGDDGTPFGDYQYPTVDDSYGCCLRHRSRGHRLVGHCGIFGSGLAEPSADAQGHRAYFGSFLCGTRLPGPRSAACCDSHYDGSGVWFCSKFRSDDVSTVHRPHRPDRSGNECAYSNGDSGSGSMEPRGAFAIRRHLSGAYPAHTGYYASRVCGCH